MNRNFNNLLNDFHKDCSEGACVHLKQLEEINEECINSDVFMNLSYKMIEAFLSKGPIEYLIHLNFLCGMMFFLGKNEGKKESEVELLERMIK
jgi:hypothetical protein